MLLRHTLVCANLDDVIALTKTLSVWIVFIVAFSCSKERDCTFCSINKCTFAFRIKKMHPRMSPN